jgi:VanZ family protein
VSAPDPLPSAAVSRDGRPGARLWIWALVAAALLSVLAFGNAPAKTMLWDAVFDAGHVPLFGLLSLAVLRMLRAHVPGVAPRHAWFAAFAITAAIGIVTELLQNFQPNREPSFADFARDLAGAATVLLTAAVVSPVSGGPSWLVRRRDKRVALGVALVILLASGAQVAAALGVVAARWSALPMLYAFDGSWSERGRVTTADHSTLTPRARPARVPSDFAEPLARLDMTASTYPGIRLSEPYPDWRDYRELAFTVVSDLDVPQTIVIRIDDMLHDQRSEDRFNRALRIAPGVNHVVIALDDVRTAPDRREMDMSRIRGIIIFAYQPPAPTHVFLGPLRLQ